MYFSKITNAGEVVPYESSCVQRITSRVRAAMNRIVSHLFSYGLSIKYGFACPRIVYIFSSFSDRRITCLSQPSLIEIYPRSILPSCLLHTDTYLGDPRSTDASVHCHHYSDDNPNLHVSTHPRVGLPSLDGEVTGVK